MAKSKLSVGAMQMYQQIADYGKNATANTIAIATTLDSATITAIGAGKKINGGDVVYVYPTLISAAGAVAVATETLQLKVTHYVSKRDFVETPVTVTFSTTAVADINSALTTAGLNNKVKAELVGTKLRIQALTDSTGVTVTGGTGLTGIKLTLGDYAVPMVFKVTANVTTVATTVALSEFYVPQGAKFDTADSLTGLKYKVGRFFGESTGVESTTSLTPDMYKGSSKFALQTEYGEGEASISITDLVFNRENLELIKGLSKKTTAQTFFSGKACSEKYKLTSATNPIEVAMFGLVRYTDNKTLRVVEVDRAKSPTLEVPLGKAFRVSTDEFTLLANKERKAFRQFTVEGGL